MFNIYFKIEYVFQYRYRCKPQWRHAESHAAVRMPKHGFSDLVYARIAMAPALQRTPQALNATWHRAVISDGAQHQLHTQVYSYTINQAY